MSHIEQTSFELNKQLIDRLYVPIARRSDCKLHFDQNFPYNPDFVNIDGNVFHLLSKHYHENVSYTDPTGAPEAREYFAARFGVKSSDVVLVPTSDQARWYLLTLFLNDEDTVACSSGLKPALSKVRTDQAFTITSLDSIQSSKLVMIRQPDVDSDLKPDLISPYLNDVSSLDDTLKEPKAFVYDEPYVLFGKENPCPSITNQKLPQSHPVFLLTDLSQVLLSDSSGFSAIILLNNKTGQFDQIIQALSNMTAFYFHPNTAFHTLVPSILPHFAYSKVEGNYQRLEERKAKIASKLKEKGIEVLVPPRLVFSLGVKKSGKIKELVDHKQIVLPVDEYFRDNSDYIYLSVLNSDVSFDGLIERLQQIL